MKKNRLRLDQLLVLAFLFVIPALLLGSTAASANGETSGGPSPFAGLATPAPDGNSPYYKIRLIDSGAGEVLEELTISGPPKPPASAAGKLIPVDLGKLQQAEGQVTLSVPAYDWVFGCSAVSGAMIAAYYDRGSFPNIYTGPTNGGVMPLDSSGWGTWTDGNGDRYPNNPLIASRNGLDGRTTRGSIDDYWVLYGSAASDPYISSGWTPHTWGSAIGDFMKTSQSNYSNTDGSTRFYNYQSSSAFTCATMVNGGYDQLDGTYGRKLFYEARGYTVTDCYNQKTDNNGGGFTFAMYKAEIDAGHPVLLNLAGHSIVGVGYDDANSTVYLHDTWDYNTYTMPWGGSYAGMALQSVSIVHITSAPLPGAFSKSAPANAATGVSTSPTLSWGPSANAQSYQYCVNTSTGSDCANWVDAGSSTSASLSGLTAGTTYYWQVKAHNTAGDTYANDSQTAAWSFTTAPASYPDLIVQSISPSSTAPALNQPVTFTVRLKNQGSAAVSSPGFYVDFFVDGPPGGCYAEGITFWTLTSLAAGATVDLSYTHPGFSTAGAHSVYAFADSFCSIDESNESNNITGPVVVNAGAAQKKVSSDFDGDGKSDLAVNYISLRYTQWKASSTGAYNGAGLPGTSAYEVVRGSDFDGDGKTDPALHYPALRYVQWLRSSDGKAAGAAVAGTSAYTIMPGCDFDGDGKDDVSAFYPSLKYVQWKRSSDGKYAGWAVPGTSPFTIVPASDYDGDGKTDLTAYYYTKSWLQWKRSSDGAVAGATMPHTDLKPAVIVPGSDFDGDGKSDPAAYYPTLYYVQWKRSTDGLIKGLALPSSVQSNPANVYLSGEDFDGDGKTDPAIYYPSIQYVKWWRSSDGKTGGSAWYKAFDTLVNGYR